MMYFNTAGMTPAAPLVGEVTILPPLAFTSLTYVAQKMNLNVYICDRYRLTAMA